jgi:hypothetical protein
MLSDQLPSREDILVTDLPEDEALKHSGYGAIYILGEGTREASKRRSDVFHVYKYQSVRQILKEVLRGRSSGISVRIVTIGGAPSCTHDFIRLLTGAMPPETKRILCTFIWPYPYRDLIPGQIQSTSDYLYLRPEAQLQSYVTRDLRNGNDYLNHISNCKDLSDEVITELIRDLKSMYDCILIDDMDRPDTHLAMNTDREIILYDKAFLHEVDVYRKGREDTLFTEIKEAYDMGIIMTYLGALL